MAKKQMVASLSQVGGRACNEDIALLAQAGACTLAVVADGLGGHGGGDVASQTAAAVMEAVFADSPMLDIEAMDLAIQAANQAVLARQTPQQEMKSTLVALFAGPGQATYGYLGDSRLYHFSGGQLMFQTQDHSVSQMAVQVGEIEPGQIRHHADRHKLLRALGAAPQAQPGLGTVATAPGDAFLLCSDGFWELVLEEEMAADLRAARNAEDWLKKMHKRLKKQLDEHSDNYSAVAVLVE